MHLGQSLRISNRVSNLHYDTHSMRCQAVIPTLAQLSIKLVSTRSAKPGVAASAGSRERAIASLPAQAPHRPHHADDRNTRVAADRQHMLAILCHDQISARRHGSRDHMIIIGVAGAPRAARWPARPD